MDESHWKSFYETQAGDEIIVCRIKESHALIIGDGHRAICIHHNAIKKAVEKHNLPFSVFPFMEAAINHGEARIDVRAKNVISFFYYVAHLGHWIQVSVKSCVSSPDFYITTVFKIGDKALSKRQKQWPEI